VTLSVLLFLLSADPARPKLGVSDFTAAKEAQAIAAAANSLVANELQRLGAFDVSTADQLRALLGYERQQQLLGCSSTNSCSSNLGAALNMDYLVTGQLTALKGTGASLTFNLDLQLVSVRTGKREQGATASGSTEQQLILNVTPATVKLVQSILKERSGSLVLVSSEAGSAVKVDEAVIGVTPLEGRVSLAGGPHIVAVEKDGYVTWQKEVRVAAGGVTQEDVHLVPSPDTISAWESKQSKLRFGAISSTVLAVAGVGAGVVMQVLAGQEYTKFVGYRSELAKGNETTADGFDNRAAAGAAKAIVSTDQTISWVGLGVGAAAAVTATVLWVLSDDPGKYRAYRELRVAFMPTSAGGFASFSGSF
jgi:hypothetical protein